MIFALLLLQLVLYNVQGKFLPNSEETSFEDLIYKEIYGGLEFLKKSFSLKTFPKENSVLMRRLPRMEKDLSGEDGGRMGRMGKMWRMWRMGKMGTEKTTTTTTTTTRSHVLRGPNVQHHSAHVACHHSASAASAWR